MADFNLAGIRVMLGMPVHRDLPVKTVRSLMETQCLFQAKGYHLMIEMQVGSSVIEAARSRVAASFLASDCNRLFWIDSDMAWKPADFLRLVCLSTKLECVGVPYTSKTDPPSVQIDAEPGELSTNEYGCIPIRGMGLGFTIVERSIIERLAEKAPKLRWPDLDHPIPHIFRCDTIGEFFRGEDMAFFHDIRALGHQVWADPSIKLGHIGSKEYTGDLSGALVQPAA